MLTKDELRQFTGTEYWYKHLSGYHYTDGIQYVAQKGGAYWLVDKILFTTRAKKDLQEFGAWKLEVNEDKTATLICEDGNYHELYREKIEGTNFPLNKIELWFAIYVVHHIITRARSRRCRKFNPRFIKLLKRMAKKAKNNPGGKPPLYKTPEELQKKIDAYFKGKGVLENVSKASSNKKKNEQRPIYTITGLCLYLGFESRQAFYRLEDKQEFSYTIKKARMQIENVYEERLQSSNSTGAIFALKNFGWKDDQDASIDSTKHFHLTEEQRREIIENTIASVKAGYFG